VPVTDGAAAPRMRRLATVALIAALVLAASALASAWAQVGPLGGPRPPPADGVIGWLFAQQALFYRALAGLIRAAKTDGSAYWGLIGISFLYGIFHAAGPGHGKAVISSYLLANEETWRRGIALSFASALLQALTAIVLVAVAALLIGATAKMMGDTVRAIEIVSYALIVLLGARLFWVKGRGFLHALHAMRSASANAHAEGHAHSHDGHAHDHHHADAHDEEESALPWGHAHGPQPQELAGPGGWHRGLSAIIAVGLRPCSGAILILVFALAQGLFWAGVASTLVMGLGTAITVAAIATLAVGAKAAAKRLAATRAGYGSLVLRGLEVAAALMVMALGVLLLTGYLASERLGMF
jgi:nickel/cobalt exporter